MSVFSKRGTNALKPISLDPGPKEGMERARSLYREAAEELFDLCYFIQVTGKLPAPIVLTEALIQYRQALALIEAWDLEASLASDEEPLLGVPVRSR